MSSGIPAANRHDRQENGYGGQDIFEGDSVNPAEAVTEELLEDDDNE